MQFLSLLLCGFFAVIGFIREKNVYNPLSIFFSFLGFILFLNILDLYNLYYQAKPYTFFVIIIGILGFFMGWFFHEIILYKKNITRIMVNYHASVKYLINYKILFLVCVFLLFFFLLTTVQVIQEIGLGTTFGQLRTSKSDFIDYTKTYGAISSLIAYPVLLALMPVSIICFHEKKKFLIFFVGFLSFLAAFNKGGRFILFYLFVQIIMSMVMLKNKFIDLSTYKKRYKNKFIAIFPIVCFVLLSIFWISSQREVGVSFFRHFYVYLSGCIPHLDYRLDVFNSHQTYTYGVTFFRGFLMIVHFVLNFFNILSWPDYYNSAVNVGYVENIVFIGPNQRFNAFVTPFYYFFIDGGIGGVFIGSLAYGFILSIFYYFFKKQYNYLNASIYLILLLSVFTTFVRWQFINPGYTLSFFYLLIFFKKRTLLK